MKYNYVEALNLKPHPEGGHYKEAFISEQTVKKNDNQNYPAGSTIYYHLSRNEFSTFHKDSFEETWHFYDGSPVIIHVLNLDGTHTQFKLGNPRLHEGVTFQATVKKDVWLAAELQDKDSFALVGCSCSPGYTQDSEVLGSRIELIEQFPQHTELITRLTSY